MSDDFSKTANGHEDTEKTNRRLTQMDADKFPRVAAGGFTMPYLRSSAFICGLSFSSRRFADVLSWSSNHERRA
jgi:hypothetical protein